MNVYLDNLVEMKYYGFTMQNLKVIKAEIEERIRVLNEELEVIIKALKIQDKHAKSGTADFDPVDEDMFPTSDEIEKSILVIDGDFKAKDVPKAIKAKFPKKKPASPNAIATALHKLVGEEKLDYVRERSGRTPAIYCKMSGTTHK